MMSLNLLDAYSIQRRIFESGPPVGAWKLGGTNRFTSNLFGVSELYFGFLFKSDVIINFDKSRVEGLFGELEVCVELPFDFSYESVYTPDDVASWRKCLGFEFPISSISNFAEKGVEILVADNCSSGKLVLSNLFFEDFDVADIQMTIGGVKYSNWNLLLKPLEEIVIDFLRLTRLHGFNCLPGQFIATGGLTSLVKFERDVDIRVHYRKELALGW